MLELLPELTGPYFDFLIYPVDECWEWRRGKKQHSLKRECFHHPQSVRIQECIVSVYLKAFYNAAERFNYYGPTEYKRDELTNLHAFIVQSIEDLQRCSDSAAIQIMLPECFKSFLYEDLHLWLPDWLRVRSELKEYDRQLLGQVELAHQGGKALLVLGI